ncbi:hypothetical protein [Pengzhenrongella phosphoraccumulans]|uniref:hypothetical protein n=1 Tax=Pengzhenrongella phosphoraccumulans TaxID=3114394 RepID=UPI00389077A5
MHQAKGMQWPAVFVSVSSEESVPQPASRWAQSVPRHPRHGDRRRRPIPGH